MERGDWRRKGEKDAELSVGRRIQGYLKGEEGKDAKGEEDKKVPSLAC